jgi:hypothetical protein
LEIGRAIARITMTTRAWRAARPACHEWRSRIWRPRTLAKHDACPEVPAFQEIFVPRIVCCAAARMTSFAFSRCRGQARPGLIRRMGTSTKMPSHRTAAGGSHTWSMRPTTRPMPSADHGALTPWRSASRRRFPRRTPRLPPHAGISRPRTPARSPASRRWSASPRFTSRRATWAVKRNCVANWNLRSGPRGTLKCLRNPFGARRFSLREHRKPSRGRPRRTKEEEDHGPVLEGHQIDG